MAVATLDPRAVPDFYGYGSDIQVYLPSGRTVVRNSEQPPAPSAWGLLRIGWAVLRSLREMWRSWQRIPLGQMECDVKEHERR
jgi:hypothetical protein